MPVSTVPEPPGFETKELRLALVCYGGVSLAIYMYGVTKELHKLVRASAQLDGRGGGEPDPVERVYRKALEAARDAGNRTRVVIDVIAGTSAGGINGICLAKALAHDVSQDSLLDLWLSRGDIAKLVDLKPLLRSFPAPILSGNRMLGWVRAAMDEMDDQADRRGTRSSLLPDGHELALFVTATDFGGYGERLPLTDPWGVTESVHRHVFRFRHVGGEDGGTLARQWNPAIAFAARATSCFPGAFPPVAIADLGDWELRDEFVSRFFPAYPLAQPQASPLASWFVDGGVLNNFPFDQALTAIVRKAAAVEVDRRLLFIDPDPPAPVEAPADPALLGPAPSFRRTVLGALSGLPRAQPILDELQAARDFNRRVERVNDVTEASTGEIAARVDALRRAHAGWPELSAALADDAAAFAGSGFIPYIRLKLDEVVQRFAAAAAQIGGFPADSSHADFVREVVRAWAEEQRILVRCERPEGPQREFLEQFDVSYRERRLLYAISLVNKLYGDTAVERTSLDEAKGKLYDVARDLTGVFAGAATGGLGAEVRVLFDPAEISRNLDPAAGGLEPTFEKRVAAFAAASTERIGELRDALRAILAPRLAGLGARTWETVRSVSERWPAEQRDAFRTDFLGFAHWDALVFPLRALNEVGELNMIEITRLSPRDSRLLPVPLIDDRGSLRRLRDRVARRGQPTEAEKLKGVSIMHFGAFFRRGWRENDYLWGRLDAAERLIRIVAVDPEGNPLDCDDLCREAFAAILADERERLTSARPLIDALAAGLPPP